MMPSRGGGGVGRGRGRGEWEGVGEGGGGGGLISGGRGVGEGGGRGGGKIAMVIAKFLPNRVKAVLLIFVHNIFSMINMLVLM